MLRVFFDEPAPLPFRSTPTYSTSSVISLARNSEATHAQRVQTALEQAEQRVAEGAQALKVKCGHDWHDEFQLLFHLKQRFPQLSLRADFNLGITSLLQQSYTADKGFESSKPLTVEILESELKTLELQWVEDPGIALKEVPIAIDEPLATGIPSVDELTAFNASTLVIKPMVLGSLEKIRVLNLRAKKMGLSLCLSHLFDGPRALEFYWELHFALSRSVETPGLGQHAGLKAYE